MGIKLKTTEREHTSGVHGTVIVNAAGFSKSVEQTANWVQRMAHPPFQVGDGCDALLKQIWEEESSKVR